MKNYGHRFACGVVFCFYLALILILKNQFSFDLFNFFEKVELFKRFEILKFTVIAFFIFPQAVFLDNLVEKYDFTIEKRDMMYFSIMIGSIVIGALSFFV